jgi:hypothetical protein
MSFVLEAGTASKALESPFEVLGEKKNERKNLIRKSSDGGKTIKSRSFDSKVSKNKE